MNKLITLLFMAVCFTAVSQPLRRGSHVILIRNISTSRFQRVNENSNISILTISGKIISGQVRLIKADTVFFHDTLVRISDIDRLYFKSRFASPGRMLLDEQRPVYVAGSHWQIICPPDTVYRTPWSYQVYFHNLVAREKKERLKTMDPLVYKNYLKWNVSKIPHLELAVSYEGFITKKLSWETELSAILGIPSWYFSTIPYPIFNYNGISVTTYPKFYFIPRTYVSIVLMYRYLWVKGMRSAWPEALSGSLRQDQYRNDYGISLRIGFMRRYGKLIVDYYVGGGIKYITVHELVYGYYGEDSNHLQWNHANHSPDVANKSLFGAVFNLGIKIGLAIGHKGN